MLRLASSWVWDFWFADDGERFHLFFLKASRALLDPDRRHLRASVGHASSIDLTYWTEHADALVAGTDGSFDDLATWTGSVVQHGDGWRMFYTGVDRAGAGLVQRIGYATSPDLEVWTRPEPPLVLGPDARWYESLDQRDWPDQAWRDPWVYRTPDGRWRMLVTARARDGSPSQRGVVGTAVSDDLERWQVQAPLSETAAGFGHLEVLQLAQVEGRHVLLFSCMTPQLSPRRRDRGERGGIWAVNVEDPDGPFDIASAYLLAREELYVGRLVRRRDGSWSMLAFRDVQADGRFAGEITDPMPVEWQGDRLVVRSDAAVPGTS